MENYIIKLKEEISKVLNINVNKINIEPPKDLNFGDITLTCFQFSKELKKNPKDIAVELKSLISKKINEGKLNFLEKVEAVGPYLNFYLKKGLLLKSLLERIVNNKLIEKKENKTIMVEFLNPNLNKPLHIGHIRNGALGESVSRILEAIGNNVIRTNLYNDRGMGISETMYAYLYLTDKKEPDKKPDHFVGDLYVLFQKEKEKNPEIEEKAKEILKRFEEKDKEIIKIWNKIRNWVIKGYEETYKKFGYHFDKIYYESEIYEKGKEIVIDAWKKGLFYKKDGAIVAPLKNYNLPDKIVLKSNGTSLYITQDIYLAKKKFEDFNLDKSIYVVASEQNLHFAQLFAICEILGIAPINKMYHLSYGMVLLPSGKMKSREGKVIDADDFFDEIKNLAIKELKKRNEQNLEISHKIALAAINFFMLKIDPKKDFVFNPEESLSFEGQSGVYLQYTHARANSLIEKYIESIGKLDFEKMFNDLVDYHFSEEEKKLISLASLFENIVYESARQMKPSIIANYLIRLAENFNSYYHSSPILKEENEKTRKCRIMIVYVIKNILKEGMYLLNIEAIDHI